MTQLSERSPPPKVPSSFEEKSQKERKRVAFITGIFYTNFYFNNSCSCHKRENFLSCKPKLFAHGYKQLGMEMRPLGTTIDI